MILNTCVTVRSATARELCGAAVFALTCVGTPVLANTFTPIPLTGVANSRIQDAWPTFTGVPYPEGSQSWGGVPWELGNGGDNTWFSRDVAGNNPRSVVIPIGVPNAESVFTLMGTWQGTTNQTRYVELEFSGSAGASFTTTFYGGVHVRDWLQNIYTNTITAPTTTPNVYSINVGPNGNSGTSRLDMQRVDLPEEFASQVLVSMTIRDFGADPSNPPGQRSYIYGLTVAVPSPSAAAVAALGFAAAMRRRR